jgi:hypothetical protein
VDPDPGGQKHVDPDPQHWSIVLVSSQKSAIQYLLITDWPRFINLYPFAIKNNLFFEGSGPSLQSLFLTDPFKPAKNSFLFSGIQTARQHKYTTQKCNSILAEKIYLFSNPSWKIIWNIHTKSAATKTVRKIRQSVHIWFSDGNLVYHIFFFMALKNFF